MQKRSGLFFLLLFIFILATLTPSFIPRASAQTQPTSPTFPRNLSLGDTGVDVSFLQFLLINKGFLHEVLPTKYFGLLTFDSLEKWQTSVGLPATGYFGPLSKAAIENGTAQGIVAVSITSTIPTATTAPAPPPTPSPAATTYARNLTIGDTGSDVSELQTFLIQQGFLTVAAPTGYFGPMTSAAVTKWQATIGLPSTGYFGPLSRAAIGTSTTNIAQAASPILTPTPAQTQNSTSTPTPTPVVNYGGGGEGGGGGGGGGGSPSPTPTPTVDTTPPTIFITLASTTATANASDNVGVTKVEFYIDGDLEATLLSTPYVFTFDPTHLTDGTHNLNAKAYDAAGNIGTSPSVAMTINNTTTTPRADTTPPSIPVGLTATAVSPTQINLSWTASTDNVGVVGYHIHRDGAYIAAVTGVTTYANTGLTASTTYTYTVFAVDAAGNLSGQSLSSSAKTLAAPADVVAPTIPTGLTVTDTTTSTVSFSWIASTDNVGVTGYRIYRGGNQIATTSVTSFTNNNLAPSTTYAYQASAYDAAGNISAQSSVVNATTKAPADITPPSIPVGLTAIPVSSTQINLAWTASTDNVGVAGYKIFRGGSQIATTKAVTTYQSTGLAASSTYTYAIAAFDAAGNVSMESSSTSAKTLAVPADTTPPTVSITNPVSSSSIPNPLTVTMNASDNVGVTKVELYIDGTLTRTMTTPPYSFTLTTTTLALGAHTLNGKAYDAAGNVGTSTNIGIIIINPIPATPKNLKVTGATTSSISLSWSASTETGGSIAGYKIYQGGTQIGTSTGTSFTATGLAASTTYTYSVASYDSSGIVSPISTSITASTLPLPSPSLNYNLGFSVGEDIMTPSLNQDLDDIASLGVGWIRIDMQWDHIQPNNASSFTWTNIDTFVAAANARHLKILAVLDYTPSWAASPACTTGTDRCAPASPAQYAAFVTAAVTRYTPEGVIDWEIWNEPNLKGSWQPAADPIAYEAFLKAGYNAVKAVNPSAGVISGSMGPGATLNGNVAPIDFLTQLYAAGGEPYFDALGFHPYSFPAMPLYAATWNAWSQMATTNPSLRSVMTANGDAGKRIWITEYGAPTGGPGVLETSATDTVFAGSPDHVTEALQALMMTQAVDTVETLPWAGPFFWFSYQDLGTSQSTSENFFGILRYDGSTKPAYQTYKSLL